VIEAPAPLEPAALAAALRAELPEFARVRVHYTPALPRNEMGKLVRRAVAERLAEAPD
jgi:acyl-coenzyme A synthetase/AMP-(fatty) acid ligase